MDPDATLEELVDLAESIEDSLTDGDGVDPEDAARLAELVTSLHAWLRKGGDLPKAWERDAKGTR